MEKTQATLRKFSHVIYVFAKIGFIAAIVGVCIAACAMVCLAVTGSMNFDIGNGVTLLLAKTDGNIATVWGTMAYALTSCALLITVMRLLMRLFANIRDCYTPFTAENAELFKKMAIWMIIVSVVPAMAGQIVGKTCAVIIGIPFSAEFADGFSIIAVLVLFAMSMVFKYGCALQEQADTTL